MEAKLRWVLLVTVMALLPACGKKSEPKGQLEVQASLPFDVTRVGESSTRPILLKNVGRGSLSIAITADTPFTADPTQVSLDPGKFAALTVHFTPLRDGDYRKVLHLAHDGDGPSAVDLLATGDCDCDDGDACTRDGCGEKGACTHSSVQCPDAAGLCWTSLCDPRTGCGFAMVTDGTPCGPPGVCVNSATCQQGACTVEPPDQKSRFPEIELPSSVGRVIADQQGNVYFTTDTKLRSYDASGNLRFAVDNGGATDVELVDADRVLVSSKDSILAYTPDGAFLWKSVLPQVNLDGATRILTVAASSRFYFVAQTLVRSSLDCPAALSKLSRLEKTLGTGRDPSADPEFTEESQIVDLAVDESGKAWVLHGDPCAPVQGMYVGDDQGTLVTKQGLRDNNHRLSTWGDLLLTNGDIMTLKNGVPSAPQFLGFGPPTPVLFGGPVRQIELPPIGAGATAWDPITFSFAVLALSTFDPANVNAFTEALAVQNGVRAVPGPLLLDDGSVLAAVDDTLYQVYTSGPPSSCAYSNGRSFDTLVTVHDRVLVAVLEPEVPEGPRSIVGYPVHASLATSGWVSMDGTPGRTRSPLPAGR